jgi:hypothetical protein
MIQNKGEQQMRKILVQWFRPALLVVVIAGSAGYAFADGGEDALVNCCGKHDGENLCRYVDTAKKNCTTSPNSCAGGTHPVCCENKCQGTVDVE